MLAQIDETSTFEVQASDTLMLPHLLVRRTQSEPLGQDMRQEKTPRGEATTPIGEPSEQWPTTPTPTGGGHNGLGNGFGLGGETTPENWPERQPNFHFGMQQQQAQGQMQAGGGGGMQVAPPQASSWPMAMNMPGSMPGNAFQGMTMAPFFGAMPGMPGMPGAAGMMPGMPGMPGMNMNLMPGMVPMQQNAQQNVNQSRVNQGAEAAVAPRGGPQLPMEPRQGGQDHSSKGQESSTRAPAGSKKNAALASSAGGNSSTGQPACPVAVYVDLSTLRERGPSGMQGRGLGRRPVAA